MPILFPEIILFQVVSRSNDSDGLVRILRELEALVLMPLKPYRRPSPEPLMISNRTDSGFDSDTSGCSADTSIGKSKFHRQMAISGLSYCSSNSFKN